MVHLYQKVDFVLRQDWRPFLTYPTMMSKGGKALSPGKELQAGSLAVEEVVIQLSRS
jgi:hypothetical protein